MSIKNFMAQTLSILVITWC